MTKEKEREKDIEAALAEGAHKVMSKIPKAVKIGGKTYKVKRLRNVVRNRIDRLNQTAYYWEQEAKKPMTLRMARKVSKRLGTLHAKTAAYYILGLRAIFMPFAFAFTWRWLNCKNAETLFEINNAGANNSDTDFFLASWQITKAQLALSMRPIGEGVKQYQRRMESAESMLEEDASPKKKESK